MIIGTPVTITKKDGTVIETTVSMVAVHEYETQKESLLSSLVQTKKMSDTWWLAWECCRADGITVKPFKQWLAELSNVEIDWGWADPKE